MRPVTASGTLVKKIGHAWLVTALNPIIGYAKAAEIATQIETLTGIEARATILGHLQRGGSPTTADRVFAAQCGAVRLDAGAEVDAHLPGARRRVGHLAHLEHPDFTGVGVTFGSGCTSGHGICGLSRFSLRSLVAVLVFMILMTTLTGRKERKRRAEAAKPVATTPGCRALAVTLLPARRRANS